jgi:hypothetical protein
MTDYNWVRFELKLDKSWARGRQELGKRWTGAGLDWVWVIIILVWVGFGLKFYNLRMDWVRVWIKTRPLAGLTPDPSERSLGFSLGSQDNNKIAVVTKFRFLLKSRFKKIIKDMHDKHVSSIKDNALVDISYEILNISL